MFRKARKYFFTLFVFHYCKLALLMMKISIQNQHSFLLSKYKLYNFTQNATCFKNIHCRKSQIRLKIRKENWTGLSTCVVLRTGEEDESRRGEPGVSGHVATLPEANIHPVQTHAGGHRQNCLPQLRGLQFVQVPSLHLLYLNFTNL